jgi:hypothetical protein
LTTWTVLGARIWNRTAPQWQPPVQTIVVLIRGECVWFEGHLSDKHTGQHDTTAAQHEQTGKQARTQIP